jgi:hypothetical protein
VLSEAEPTYTENLPSLPAVADVPRGLLPGCCRIKTATPGWAVPVKR